MPVPEESYLPFVLFWQETKAETVQTEESFLDRPSRQDLCENWTRSDKSDQKGGENEQKPHFDRSIADPDFFEICTLPPMHAGR